MNRRPMITLLLTGLLTAPGFAMAADQAVDQQRLRTQEQERIQEQIYGSQMMTEQERNQYRARMRAATSAEEQEQIRNEHHERMRERAATQGITLPDAPPPRGGGGMGPGGGGMGSGGGRR